MPILTSSVFQVRNQSQLPFYCRPLSLFVAVWLLMLAAFQLHISYTSYPDISIALILFVASLLSFLFGYATIRVAYFSVGHVPSGYSHYQIDLVRLRRFHLVLVGIVLSIMIMNWKLHGLPPIFGFIGLDTLDYIEYGSLRQLLFPCILLIFVSAPLEMSAPRRWCLLLFAPLCLLIYVSRGLILIMMFQALVVFSVRTSLSKRKIYLVAITTVCCALILSDFIGNGRSNVGSAGLLGYMQIKRIYYDWPTAYLWMISYISTPISNLCWIVHVYPYEHPSLSFLNSALPSFWSGQPLEVKDLGSDMIVDGVHTYIAKYFLDFWFFGIFGINYIWGLIAAYMSAGDRLTRRYLPSAVLLGCLGFIFFSDFLSLLVILIEVFAIDSAQRYFTIEIDGSSKTQTRAVAT
jgi:oligosaccharide repeat unit polymerase